MKLLLLISFLFFQVSCESQYENTQGISEDYVLIVNLGGNNFFLFPITDYNNKISLSENLRSININQGRLLSSITEEQYNYIFKNSTKYKRGDVPDDFDDSVKYVSLIVSKEKYQYINETNSQLYKKHKKLERKKIKLNDNITLNLLYNYLGVEIKK